MPIPPQEAAELMRSMPESLKTELIQKADNVIDSRQFFSMLISFGAYRDEDNNSLMRKLNKLISEISPDFDYDDDPPKGAA